MLIDEINPDLDASILAAYLLSAIAPSTLQRLLSGDDVDLATLQRAARQLTQIATRSPTS